MGRKRKIPIEDRDKIDSLYKKLNSIPKVAHMYDVTPMSMWRYMKKHQIETRKKGIKAPTFHTIDENAFSSLNEQNEYWMGFLYADGFIVKQKIKSGTSKRFGCFLKSTDKSHIQKCLDFLNTDYQIRTKKSRGVSIIGGKEYIIKGEGVGFQITNSKIVDDLIGYGFTTHKSWSGLITDKRLLKSIHFWRGLIDGDGSIGYSRGEPIFSLIANELMVKEFHNYIYKYILYNSVYRTKYLKKKGTKSSFSMSFGSTDAYKLINHFYFDSKVFLERKKKIADSIIQNYKPINKKYGFEEYSKIADLLIQNYKHREITEELNVSFSTVGLVKKSLGLSIRSRKRLNEVDWKI